MLCISLGGQCVTNSLPQDFMFDVSTEGFQVYRDGRIKFHGGRLVHPGELHGVPLEELSEILWVEGKVPEWVNLTLVSYSNDYCFIEVMTSRRLTDDESRFMHRNEGNPPFHVLGPQGGSQESKISLPRRK